MSIDEAAILKYFSQPKYRPNKTKPLAKELAIPQKEYADFRGLLQEMERAGTIARLKGGRWALPGEAGLIIGALEVKRGGFGFLRPDDPRREDIFIPENEIGDAINGDRVAVRIERRMGGRGHRQFGCVVRIIQRSVTRLVGCVETRGKGQVFIPEDKRIPSIFELISDSEAEFYPGDKVLLEIVEWPEDSYGAGRVIERLGPAGEPDTETAAILANFNAPGPFPEEVMAQIHAGFKGVTDEDRRERLDFTAEICFTIDPDDARDFDDAISVERTRDGYTLGVHIADVSHYVLPDTPLDQEAHNRSTSIYLPGRVIPMLPPELSNDLCSLRPNEERFAMSVFMELDKEAQVKSSFCTRTIIRSRRRLTYREVYIALEEEAEAKKFNDQEVLSRLRTLRTLARKMHDHRLQAGSVELNLAEYKVLVDKAGKAQGMIKVEHDFSHNMVEECMLAANVEMAKFAARHGLGILFRVHEPPEEEDLKEMAAFLQAYGYNLRLPFSSHNLNSALQSARGKPEEHPINLAVLKSMRQAVYAPENLGHFALAFESYSHFTSPIRRYPDLHLHRSLKELFPEGEYRLPEEAKVTSKSRGSKPELHLLGLHTSERERRAMKIEEEVKELRRLELINQCDQKIHRAVITGIRPFGVFVELEEFFVESLLPTEELARHGRAPVELLPNGRPITAPKKEKGKGKGKGKGRKPVRSQQAGEGFHLGEEILVSIKEINLSDRTLSVEYIGEPE
ncbi:MAG: VacB/RNase II family 3'-5' exoribonuclease [Planctomycetes bacterium]|nr:VacB/RNase II family 3'-5' exoribonuclease [Planctomycetota bacterium]